MLSPADMLVVGVAALLFFGPDQLPKVARRAGQVVRDVQATSASFIHEMERAADEPDRRPPYVPTEPYAPDPPTVATDYDSHGTPDHDPDITPDSDAHIAPNYDPHVTPDHESHPKIVEPQASLDHEPSFAMPQKESGPTEVQPPKPPLTPNPQEPSSAP